MAMLVKERVGQSCWDNGRVWVAMLVKRTILVKCYNVLTVLGSHAPSYPPPFPFFD